MKQNISLPKQYKAKVRYALETTEMGNVLTEDIKKIIGFSKEVEYKSDMQFWMRIMVRTIIDSIDALIYRLRKMTQELIKFREIEKKLPPKPKKTNLRYIFKVFAVALDSTFEIKEDDEKLKDYSEARKIRNRITHPKSLADLNISLEEEYVKFADTYYWVTNCIKQLNEQSKLIRKKKK
jgi:hypothetical protein